MMDQQEKNRRRPSLRRLMILMFIAGIIMSGLLFFIARQVMEQYNETKRAEDDFLSCQDAVHIVQDAINELSERARNFVVTGNAKEADGYFDEVESERSMDNAVEELKGYLTEDRPLEQLNTAIQLHSRMAKMQCHAMRLAMQARGQESADYPLLAEIALSDEELALSPEELLDRALDMLFNLDYTHLKGQIDVRVRLCTDALTATMAKRQQSATEKLERLLDRQRTLITVMAVSLLLMLVFVKSFVVSPINRLVEDIRKKAAAAVTGSAEISFLAETYNWMHGQMEAANSRLSYEAAHDALTEVYNRSAFDELLTRSSDENIALLILDVDYFKQVNDTYGHDMGDRVLKRVARVLRHSFREADKICRIGGDEFCVIVIGVSSASEKIIREKLGMVADSLRSPEDGIPGVTVSVGCAFSDRLSGDESLLKKADRALYRVKEHGRDGFAFYEAES